MTMAVKPVQDISKPDGTTTVRVSHQTHATLKRLAEELGTPITSVVDGAVERYRRDIFLRGASEEYARLRSDPAAWAEELAERRVWDAALKDGLEPEEWTEDDFLPAERATEQTTTR